jgi:hypothetical protein
LVIDVDERNSELLIGEGAIYLVPPGIKKLRLGNYYVSTTGLDGWSSVQMAGPSNPPKMLDNKLTIWGANDDL